ncbi:MAG: biosynthetic-type acetolactate synthase large subunit [Eubacteriales bacterium]|nr:biosynthetic-type acetolactate synthase large subunit [Eubacteriales bacterium]
MKLTGAGVIVEVLAEQGVDAVFGYPGGAVLNLYDELYRNSHRITHYITCHEQGAAHAADGYARATGKVGVVLATSGPGATNLVTGIANAYLDSVPLVAITGNVANTLLGRDSFQEVDITGVTMPITKHNYIARDKDRLADMLREAFDVARSGRPGPVLIDVPKDIQMAQIDFTPAPAAACHRCGCVQQQQLDEAVRLIRQAQRPYIYAGGGVVASNAAQQLKAFAGAIDAPVGTSMMGKSAMHWDQPGFLGMVGMHGRLAANQALAQSDLIIAVGVRFSDRATGNKKDFTQGHRVLHIDIDPAEIGKNIPAYTGLIGDVKAVLSQLLDRLAPQQRPQWHEQVQALRNQPDNQLKMPTDRLTPRLIIETVNRRMPPDGIVATDVGQHQMWTTQYYRFSCPRTFITSGGLGAMGFGMGAAIGACIGSGRKRTVLFTSDGSFHMNLNELATAVTNELPLIIVVLNNGVLGMVRQWQTLFFDKRYSNTTMHRKTDFVALAHSFGAQGIRVAQKDELEPALTRAMATSGPVLLDCAIDADEMVLPMVPPNGSFDDIILR